MTSYLTSSCFSLFLCSSRLSKVVDRKKTSLTVRGEPYHCDFLDDLRRHKVHGR